jgi:hypothetical protein
LARRNRAQVDDTPVQLEIGGKTYLVSQMTLGAQFALQRAAAAALPPPQVHRPDADLFLAQVEEGLAKILEEYAARGAEGLAPREQEKHLLNLRGRAQIYIQQALRETLEAFVDWPGQVGTPEMSAAFMGTEAGLRLIVRHALLPHQPDLTDADLEALIDRITVTQTERLVEAFMPPPRDEADAGPTQPAGAGATSIPLTGTSSTRPSPGITDGVSRPSIA